MGARRGLAGREGQRGFPPGRRHPVGSRNEDRLPGENANVSDKEAGISQVWIKKIPEAS